MRRLPCARTTYFVHTPFLPHFPCIGGSSLFASRERFVFCGLQNILQNSTQETQNAEHASTGPGGRQDRGRGGGVQEGQGRGRGRMRGARARAGGLRHVACARHQTESSCSFSPALRADPCRAPARFSRRACMRASRLHPRHSGRAQGRCGPGSRRWAGPRRCASSRPRGAARGARRPAHECPPRPRRLSSRPRFRV